MGQVHQSTPVKCSLCDKIVRNKILLVIESTKIAHFHCTASLNPFKCRLILDVSHEKGSRRQQISMRIMSEIIQTSLRFKGTHIHIHSHVRID